MLSVFLKGFALGGSLIVAIGAQNAYVLSQGVRKKYNLIIPFICSVSDILLIFVGIFGVGRILAENQSFSLVASIGGALFLFFYGLRSFISFFKKNSLEADSSGPQSLKAALLFTLGVTLLNPHVYIDTILLLGSIRSQFAGIGRYYFGAGAATASILWFFSLSLAGSLLSPLFRKPLAWKVLDFFIGFVMWYIAFSLVKPLL